MGPSVASWMLLGDLLGPLGASWEPLGSLLESLGRVLGVSWESFGVSWRDLGGSWSDLGSSWGRLGSLLGGSWEHFGGILRQFGGNFGAWKLSLKRFIEILKNLQKPCKVLQKWGFGESEIDEKLSLEGYLGAILKLSWHVRGQLGANMGQVDATWRAKRHQD